MKKLSLLAMGLLLFMNVANTCYADQTKIVEHWMLLDASASLSALDAQRRDDAAWNMAATLLRTNKENRVGIAAFGCGEVEPLLNPTNSSGDIRSHIQNIGNQEQCTNIEGALNLILEKAKGTDGKIVAYLFTDGRVDLPPQLSSNIRDAEDKASERRIKSTIIPNLSQENIVVNVIALQNQSLDKLAVQLLQELSNSTSGQSTLTKDSGKIIRDWFRASRQGLNAKIHQGGIVYFDKKWAETHDMLIPENARIIVRSGEVAYEQFPLQNVKRVEFDLQSEKGAIQVVGPDNQGVPIKDIDINSKSKIIAEPFSPLFNKINFYQNEVVKFKLKLRPNLDLGSEEIFETIKSRVKPLVKISGVLKEMFQLKKNDEEDGQGENRGMTFEYDWWITKCGFSGNYPGSFNYEFVVKDHLEQMNYYEVIIPSVFSGYSIVKLPPDLGNWEFKNSAGGSDVFKNLADNTYYVDGNLKINFTYSFNNMTIAHESQRLLPWKPDEALYFMDGSKLDGNGYHLTDKDIGEKIVTCIYNATEAGSLNQVKLKFQKKINIAKGPFSIQPLKESLGTKPSYKKEFTVPFAIKVNSDAALAVDLKSGKLPLLIRKDSKYINLQKGQDGIKNIRIIAEKNLPKGRHDITIIFSNSKILKRPLSYKVSLKIVPYWWFILASVVSLLLLIYLFLLFYWTIWWNYKTAKTWTKGFNIGTNTEKIFNLKLFLPGRQFEILNRANERVYDVKVKFSGGIKIIPANNTYKLLMEKNDIGRRLKHLNHIHLSDSRMHGGSHSIQFEVRINPGKNDPEVRKIVTEKKELMKIMQQNRFVRP